MNENAELLRSKIFILRSLVWNYFLKFQTFQQMVFFFFLKKKKKPFQFIHFKNASKENKNIK